MVAALAALAAVLLVTLTELLHWRRTRRIAALVFGPSRGTSALARMAPVLRVLGAGSLAFGLTVLLLETPKVHELGAIDDAEVRHLVMVLDVSPSMRLQDAGPTGKQSRTERAKDLMESFFQRVSVETYRITVIATYNGAKPVVQDTRDLEVVRNILDDLPMHYAFPVGRTDIFSGLHEAARIAKPWEPRSTVVMLISDGDTVPATGMPKMPVSVRDVLVVGVGDPLTGRFIDGRQSRQDRSTLRQVATRLGGIFHDGNEKHLSTEVLQAITARTEATPFEQLTLREYALIACGIGGFLLALLPLLLRALGTSWRPGVSPSRGTPPAAEATQEARSRRHRGLAQV